MRPIRIVSRFAHFLMVFVSVLPLQVLQLRDLEGISGGELASRVLSESGRAGEACVYLFFLFSSSIMLFVVATASVLLVGPWALLGCALYVLFVPIQVRLWIARLFKGEPNMSRLA